MSDNRAGWAELLAAPLGAEPSDTPLAALPCAFPLVGIAERVRPSRAIVGEP